MINQSRLIFITLLVCSMSFCQQLSRESSMQKIDSLIQDERIDPRIDPSINPIEDKYLDPVERSEDDPDADLDLNTISKPDASIAPYLEPNTMMIIPSKMDKSMEAQSRRAIIDLTPCIRGDWPACRAQLSNLIRGFIASFFSFQNGGTVTILNRTCRIGIRRRIHRFRLVYDGRLTCPFGQASEARTYKSARGAAEAAVRRFFEINAALIQSMINNPGGK